MKVVTGAEMRRIDQITIKERGTTGLALMERAGKAVAREVLERFQPDSVAVLAGKGNNGGDGFVAARELHRRGIPTVVYALFDTSQARGDARKALEKLPPEVRIERPERAQVLREELIRYDLVIDAILGTGLRGAAEGFVAEAIEALNACRTLVVSVDVPSGLLGAGPQAAGPIVRAALTVALGLPKIGLVLDPGVRMAGQVSIADLGFPNDLLEDDAITVNLLTAPMMAGALPHRDPAGHKGTFGKTLIVAGSEGMTGAAILVARAASRSGVGLVYCAYPRALGAVMEAQLIEPVKRPLPGSEPWFVASQAPRAIREAKGVDSIAVGPGLGLRESTGKFLVELISKVQAPMVIDADGLNLLAGRLHVLKERTGPTILTPHPGEAARLLDCSVREIESDRLEACRSLAADYDLIVVLKGARTIISAPDGQRYINPSGNSGLAKGGSGDVLTGLIAGFLAQGCLALAAAQLAVFLHGVAADEAAKSIGVRALIPSDVIDSLGPAFLYLKKSRD